MTQGVECAGENEAVVDAAKKLADLNWAQCRLWRGGDSVDEALSTMKDHKVRRLP
jgi:hypothetical protein